MKQLPTDNAYQPFLSALQKNGISDSEFLIGILCQLNQISMATGTEQAFLLSSVKGSNPTSQNEVLLLVQMAAIYDAVIIATTNLAAARDPESVERFTNALAKLARAFAAHMEALHRCRSVNENNINIQNFQVREGAQAILNNITHIDAAPPPLAIVDARGTEPATIEPEVMPVQPPAKPGRRS